MSYSEHELYLLFLDIYVVINSPYFKLEINNDLFQIIIYAIIMYAFSFS